jgi:hypothetical protein
MKCTLENTSVQFQRSLGIRLRLCGHAAALQAGGDLQARHLQRAKRGHGAPRRRLHCRGRRLHVGARAARGAGAPAGHADQQLPGATPQLRLPPQQRAGRAAPDVAGVRTKDARRTDRLS